MERLAAFELMLLDIQWQRIIIERFTRTISPHFLEKRMLRSRCEFSMRRPVEVELYAADLEEAGSERAEGIPSGYAEVLPDHACALLGRYG